MSPNSLANTGPWPSLHVDIASYRRINGTDCNSYQKRRVFVQAKLIGRGR